MVRRAILIVIAVLAVSASSAGATTVTRHQSPHYRVTASLLPTSVAVGGRLTVRFTVTNTTARAHMASIGYDYEAPDSGEGAFEGPIRLAPHASWTVTFRRTASEAGGYTAVVRASDRAGTSHARATATAS